MQVQLDIPIFLSNAAAAFGLNMSVFMLIGKTSALTMNIAGVIKDSLLIALSVLIFKAQVTLGSQNLRSVLPIIYGSCGSGYSAQHSAAHAVVLITRRHAQHAHLRRLLCKVWQEAMGTCFAWLPLQLTCDAMPLKRKACSE